MAQTFKSQRRDHEKEEGENPSLLLQKLPLIFSSMKKFISLSVALSNFQFKSLQYIFTNFFLLLLEPELNHIIKILGRKFQKSWTLGYYSIWNNLFYIFSIYSTSVQPKILTKCLTKAEGKQFPTMEKKEISFQLARLDGILISYQGPQILASNDFGINYTR